MRAFSSFESGFYKGSDICITTFCLFHMSPDSFRLPKILFCHRIRHMHHPIFQIAYVICAHSTPLNPVFTKDLTYALPLFACFICHPAASGFPKPCFAIEFDICITRFFRLHMSSDGPHIGLVSTPSSQVFTKKKTFVPDSVRMSFSACSLDVPCIFPGSYASSFRMVSSR